MFLLSLPLAVAADTFDLSFRDLETSLPEPTFPDEDKDQYWALLAGSLAEPTSSTIDLGPALSADDDTIALLDLYGFTLIDEVSYGVPASTYSASEPFFAPDYVNAEGVEVYGSSRCDPDGVSALRRQVVDWFIAIGLMDVINEAYFRSQYNTEQERKLDYLYLQFATDAECDGESSEEGQAELEEKLDDVCGTTRDNVWIVSLVLRESMNLAKLNLEGTISNCAYQDSVVDHGYTAATWDALQTLHADLRTHDANARLFESVANSTYAEIGRTYARTDDIYAAVTDQGTALVGLESSQESLLDTITEATSAQSDALEGMRIDLAACAGDVDGLETRLDALETQLANQDAKLDEIIELLSDDPKAVRAPRFGKLLR